MRATKDSMRPVDPDALANALEAAMRENELLRRVAECAAKASRGLVSWQLTQEMRDADVAIAQWREYMKDRKEVEL